MEPANYEFVGWETALNVWGPRILGAIIILVAAFFIGKAVKWALAKGIDRLPGTARANEGHEPKHTVGARLGEVGFWLVLLVVLVAALGVLNLNSVVAPLNTLLNDIAGFLPNLLGAALIFFVGFVLATLAKRVVEAALQAANADHWLERIGMTRATGAVGLSSALGTLVFILILIPVSIAALEQLNIAAISEPAVAVLTTVLDAIPRVLAAAIVLAIGWFIGRWVAGVIERVLPATGFDRSLGKLTGLSSFRTEPSSAPATKITADGAVAGPMTPSRVVANIVLFAIVAFTAIEAARLLQFAAIAVIVEEVLGLAVQVLVGGVIIAAGVIIADLLANAIDRSTAGADRFASTLVRWATIALATAMGLSFMGIADDVVLLAFGPTSADAERPRPADVTLLKSRLWDIFEGEGKTLAAMNASLFAADLSDRVGARILEARREIADRVVRTWCIAKGIAVAFNPVPVADLFAAAFIDIGMVVHLSKVYGLPVNRSEAGSLVRVIVAEAAALMGTVWALHFVSSALKVGTLGLSTILTAGAQGAIAWYSTYVVGRVAAEWLSRGKSWGAGGPKRVVRDILDSLDQDSVLEEARREIRARLGLRAAT